MAINLILAFLLGAAIAACGALVIITRLQRRLAAATASSQTSSAAEAMLQQTMQRLAQEALLANNQNFVQLAEEKLKASHAQQQTTLQALVAPLQEKLGQLQQSTEALEQRRAGAYESLLQQITQLHGETSKLNRALRAPHARGRWGEVQLQRLIEMAGMQPHADYSLQNSLSVNDEAASRLRPDCIIHLPGGRQIIIDVKTPLEAYLDYENAADDVAQREALTRFSRHVRTHVDQLSSKAYWQHAPQAADFVIMFLPGEHLLATALKAEPDLFEAAMGKKVIMASTATLMLLLQAYAHGWRQEAMIENASKVSALARDLYGRLGTLLGHFNKLGDSIFKSLKTYNDVAGSLEARVLPAARKFADLGALRAEAEGELATSQLEEASPRNLKTPDNIEENNIIQITEMKN